MAAAALKYLSLTNRFTGDFYLSFSRYLKKMEKTRKHLHLELLLSICRIWQPVMVMQQKHVKMIPFVWTFCFQQEVRLEWMKFILIYNVNENLHNWLNIFIHPKRKILKTTFACHAPFQK